MLQLLVAAVVVRPDPDFSLPFVIPLPESADAPTGEYARWHLSFHEPTIEVWMTDASVGPVPLSVKGKTWLEIKHELFAYAAGNKRGIADSLGLPAEIKTTTASGQDIRFGIDKPKWLDFRRQRGDMLTTIGPAGSKPYVMCHVLVNRTNGNQREILLGKRLAGYAKGTYTLPGGKQGPEETLLECAARELKEETGLRLLNGRPVSIHHDRLPGKPPVQSVGVLVEAYEGMIRNREPDQNANWEWFDVNGLPPLVFVPARHMIMQWINNTYPGLTWDDVESRTQVQEPEVQLALPLLY